MISAEIHLLGMGSGGFTRRVQIIVRSDAGGVGACEVRNASGSPVDPFALSGACAPMASFELELASTHFPVSVWASECEGGADPAQLLPVALQEFDGANAAALVRRPPFCPPATLGLPPSAECNAARSQALARRNRAIELCGTVRRWRATLPGAIAFANWFYGIAAGLFVLALLAFALAFVFAATGFGIALSIVIVVVATGLLALAVLVFRRAQDSAALADRVRRDLEAAERDLASAQEEFQRAAMEVTRSCCPGDFFDTDVALPGCS